MKTEVMTRQIQPVARRDSSMLLPLAWSGFPENQIYTPTPFHMRLYGPAVPDQLLVGTTGIDQGVTKNCEACSIQRPLRQLGLVVDALGDAADRGVIPGEDGLR